MDPLAEEFTTFNRQRELERIERERKEEEWESELLKAMEASGSSLSSQTASTSTPRLTELTEDVDDDVHPCSSSSSKMSHVRVDKNLADSKKLAWSKRRSITMPEGDKVWRKSKP